MAPEPVTSTGKLPSELVYKQFEVSDKDYCTQNGGQRRDGIVVDVYGDWYQRGIQSNSHKDIVNAWCRTNSITVEKVAGNYNPCDFLYYWIGDKINGKLNHKLFSAAMSIIYQKLQKHAPIKDCNNLYPNIIDTYFGWAKQLFDFGYNYENLKQLKERNPESCWPKYKEHWEAAKKAYGRKDDICGGNHNCKIFMEKYDTYFQNGGESKPLACAAVSKEVVVSEDEQDDDELSEEEGSLLNFLDDLDDEEEGNLALSQLPSREKYSELKEKSENGGDTECKSGVKAKLGTHITNNGTTVNKIMGAFCHINEVEEKKRNSEEWCDYLYFWVGKMLSRNMEDTKFKTTMEKCRNDVFDGQKESKCEFPYTPTKKEVFAAYRRMFDYQKDKDFIRPELRGKGVTCPTKYSTYLRKVRYAYKVMSAECKQEGNSTFEWCKKFEGWYPQYKSRNKLDLKCKLEKMAKHKPEEELSPQVEPSSSSGSDPIETTNTKMTPAISGAAATIAGLGTVAFFLYKYTSLFSGVRNTHKNRRKKSSQHNFDTLTEHTLTEYSTDTSTIVDLSTTDNSTVYNDPRTRGTNNNGNKQRANISYHHM